MRSIKSSCPPHDLEAESSVLGAVMLAPAWLRACHALDLRAEEFYRQSHRQIYDAILTLEKDGRAIDHVTVSAQLALTGELEKAGGGEYVVTLIERIPSIANTHAYVEIVKELARRRELLRVGQQLVAGVDAGDATVELVELATAALAEVAMPKSRPPLRFTAPATSWGEWEAPR